MKGFFTDLSRLDNLADNDYGIYVTSDALFQGTSGIGVIIHYGYENTRLVQLLLRPGGSIFRQKWGDSWDAWSRYESNIPTFYKNYVDLQSLVDSVLDATQLSFVFNDSNIDSMTRRGIYHVYGYSGSHFPTNAFGVFLFLGDVYKTQIFLDMYQNIIHYRRNVGNGWSAWYDVSATAQ